MALLYLRAAASVAFLALAAAGAGRWIARLFPKNASALDRAALTLLGGLGVLGTSLFVIGQWNFSRPLIVAVMTIAAAFGIAPILGFARDAYSHCKLDAPPKLAAIVVVFVLLVTAVAGFAEITGGWDNDAISYHLLGPKVWLREALVRPVPDNCLTAFPQTAEILFAALLSVGGNRAPGFSSLLTFALFLLIVAAIARRAGLGRHAAWWCVAIVATMPAAYAGAHTGFIDVIYTGFVLAAVCVALGAQSPGEFAALGLFCGFAMGTKYTGILAVPAIFLVVVVMHAKSLKSASLPLLKNLTIAAIAACLVACPFYLRNWLLLGSPIYPAPLVFFRFFHPKYLSPDLIRQMQIFLWHRGQGLGRGPLAYLLLPFNLTYHTSNFHGAGGIGLVPLAFFPFALILALRSTVARALSLLAFLLTTTWFAQQESRYLIPVYPILAILAVLGWRWLLATTGKPVRVLAAIIVALSISYGCYMILSGRRDDLHAVVSPSFALQFRYKYTPSLASFEYLNRTASVQKVLILDRSVSPYYLDRNYLKPIGTWGERVLPYAASAGDVLPHLKELGISHVLDVNSTVGTFQIPQNFPGLQLVLDLPDQRVYRVVE
jgi:Dolichyl-phosphate-mannose-protein mannosyltransferase